MEKQKNYLLCLAISLNHYLRVPTHFAWLHHIFCTFLQLRVCFRSGPDFVRGIVSEGAEILKFAKNGQFLLPFFSERGQTIQLGGGISLPLVLPLSRSLSPVHHQSCQFFLDSVNKIWFTLRQWTFASTTHQTVRKQLRLFQKAIRLFAGIFIKCFQIFVELFINVEMRFYL